MSGCWANQDTFKRSNTPCNSFVAGSESVCAPCVGGTHLARLPQEETLAPTACEVCQATTDGVLIPVIVAVLTYVTFGHNTMRRYNGDDSHRVKVMSCFAGLFGGLNFLSILVCYWHSCVRVQAMEEGRQAHMGVGLLCIGIGASLLKIVCGVLHLGLPVEDDGASMPLKERTEDGAG